MENKKEIGGRRTNPQNGCLSIADTYTYTPKLYNFFGAVQKDIRWDTRSDQDKEDRLYNLIINGLSYGQYREVVRRAGQLPYKNKMNLISRVRKSLGDERANELWHNMFLTGGERE